MGNVPAAVKILNIPVCDRNLMPLNYFLERIEDSFRQVSIKGLCEVRLPCEIDLGWFHIRCSVFSESRGWLPLWSYISSKELQRQCENPAKRCKSISPRSAEEFES